MTKENEQSPVSDSHLEPLQPSPLPPELAEFLRDKTFACLMQATDRGTVLVIKALAHEIASARGRVPVQLRHELYQHPTAPVIRTIITLYDQPTTPLALETFTNVVGRGPGQGLAGAWVPRSRRQPGRRAALCPGRRCRKGRPRGVSGGWLSPSSLSRRAHQAEAVGATAHRRRGALAWC